MAALSETLVGRRAWILGTTGAVLFAGLVAVAVRHPIPVFGVLLVGCLAIAVVRFPIAALAGMLFLQPFHSAILIALQNRAGDSVGPLRYWEDGVIAALFARAVIGRLLKERRLPLDNIGDNLILLYAAAYVVLGVALPSRGTVFEALIVYLEGPVLFLAIRFLRPTRRQLWTCLAALLSAAAIMGAVAVYEKFGPHEGLLRWYGVEANQVAYSASAKPYRSASFLVDTLILAFYMAGTVPLAAAIMTMRTRWRAAAFFTFAACAGGLICTITRSGYIGGGVGVVLVVLFAARNPRIRLALIGLTIVVAGGFSAHYIANGTLTRGESNTAHQNAVTRDLNLLSARPFGYGLGTTDRFRFRTKAPGQLGATENTYLARALEGGVQSLAIYLIALFAMIMRLRARRLRARADGDPDGAALATGAMGVIVAIALAGLFLGVLERVVEIVLWGVPAIALSWPLRERPSAAPIAAERESAGVAPAAP